ncbi:MAG: 5-(carboxyamino)imidazole ribonucleotide synthase [Saprospiraceae bacterium]|nr:5-(carboxyamino)imidazole ribonucleotide synthase [Saprospiraceae bacterium]
MIQQKIGILGGGQLGKMLCQEASKLGIRLNILEKDNTYPSAGVCPDITYGDFKNYDDVLAFGRKMDIVTVEIEAVNTEALHQLEKEGKAVYPQPALLDLIKDKGEQKTWYATHHIPTAPFELFGNADTVKNAVKAGKWSIPFVQKARKDGYDGQGVKVVRTVEDLDDLLDCPCLLENMADIEKEISVIVARRPSGDIKSFPVVEMEFHPTANLVEFLFSPSSVSEEVQQRATQLAEKVGEEMGIVGLLAVELFLTKSGDIWVNEVAPRPHNSGHQTIEGNITSQYAQHLRAIMDLPLGDTSARSASVMVNVLGEPEYTGDAYYEGLSEALEISGAHIHLYGKKMTKPFRKMGHATIVDTSLESAIEKAKTLKSTLKVITKK